MRLRIAVWASALLAARASFAGEWDPPSRAREAPPAPSREYDPAPRMTEPGREPAAPFGRSARRLNPRYLEQVYELQREQSDVQAQVQALLAIAGASISQATRNQFEAARFAKTRADKAWRRLSREGRGEDPANVPAGSNYDRELDDAVGRLGDVQQEQQALVGAAFAETAALPAAKNQIEAVKFAQTRARKAYQALSRTGRYE